MNPRITVEPAPNGEGYSVMLVNSNLLKRFGFNKLQIIRVLTQDAAHDWVSRLKSFKTRRSMARFIQHEGRAF